MQRKANPIQPRQPIQRQNKMAKTDERSGIPSQFYPPQGDSQQVSDTDHLSERESILSIIDMLLGIQQQQREQVWLLKQLAQEVEALKELQTQQDSTVGKLDRQLRRARIWRISWQLLRWAVIASVIGAIIYVIGLEQILAIWAHIIWLLT